MNWLPAWAALALAVAPGLYVASAGRRLPAPGDPLLPERMFAYRQHSSLILLLCGGLLLMFAMPAALWAGPGMALGFVLASFPTRRRLLGETWALPEYAWFTFRLFVGFAGFWMALMVGPLLLAAHGPRAPGVDSVALLLMLLAWSVAPASWLLRWLGAEPLPRGDLRDALEDLAARARTPPPALYRAGPPGSRIVNAVALPALRGPGAVVFSATLLDTFEAREVVAVHAHELAHLEHFTKGELLRRLGLVWFAAICGTLVAPAVWPEWGGLVWMLFLLAIVVILNHGHQGHEAESDRRAVELLGDADALADALVKLHAMALMPRRMDPEVERSATHPSLARRLRAIRQGAAPTLETPVAFASSHPGRWVVLAPGRAYWLEGVPPETPSEPDALRAQARVVEATPYAELSGLRLRPKGKAVELVASETGRRPRSLLLPPERSAEIQAALDAVEGVMGSARARPSTAVVALLALAALLLGMLHGLPSVAVLPLAALALSRSGAATWLALAAVAAGSAALAMWGPATGIPGLAIGHALIAAGLAAIAVGELRRGDAHPTHARAAAIVSAACALFAAASLAVSLPASPSLLAFHHALARYPSLWICLAGLGLAAGTTRLAGVRRVAVRGAGAAMLALSVALGAFALPGVARRVVDAPLLAPMPSVREGRGSIAFARPRPLPDGDAWGLIVSPDGSRVAWWGPDPDDEEEATARWLPFGDEPRMLPGVEALAFVGAKTALALRRDDDGLRLLPLGGDGEPTSEGWSLPALYDTSLAVDSTSGRWRVGGLRDDTTRVVIAGSGSDAEVTTREWTERPGSTYDGWGVVGDRASLQVVTTWPHWGATWRAPLIALAGAPTPSTQLWWFDATEGRRLAIGAGSMDCRPPPVGGERFTCTLDGPDGTSVWWVERGRLEAAVRAPASITDQATAPDGRWAAWVDVSGRRSWSERWRAGARTPCLLLVGPAGPGCHPAPATPWVRELQWSGPRPTALAVDAGGRTSVYDLVVPGN